MFLNCELLFVGVFEIGYFDLVFDGFFEIVVVVVMDVGFCGWCLEDIYERFVVVV